MMDDDDWRCQMDDDDERWMMMMEDEKVKKVETFSQSCLGCSGDHRGGGIRMALQKFDSNQIYKKKRTNFLS